MNSETEYFYKYMPFDPDGSLRVITDGTMKFSSPDEFNDPFDCLPDKDVDSYVRRFEKDPELKRQVRERMGLSPGDWIANRKKLVARLRNEFAQGTHDDLIRDRLGICCLTRNPVNLLMWAHYGYSHKGFVVEFSVPVHFEPHEIRQDPFFDVRVLASLPVKYTEDKPMVSALDSTDDNIEKEFYVKSKAWEYEKEYRVLSRDLGPGIHQYHRDRILSSVIAGCRMTADDRQVLQNAVDTLNSTNNTSVAIYQAEPIDRRFGLRIPGHPVWATPASGC